MLFKRGSNAAVIEEAQSEAKEGSSSDEEKKRSGPSSVHSGGSRSNQTEIDDAQVAAAEAPAMTDIFSWQHLNYTVPLAGGGTRKLLDDISGYVAPGKLTALVGSSGAGKVRLCIVLYGFRSAESLC